MNGAESAAGDRFDEQYFMGVMNPSDNYVLAAPRTNIYRLGADETRFENLALAGDWTRNPVSFGCLESAAMSGILAARALAGKAVRRPFYDWLPAPEARSETAPAMIPRLNEPEFTLPEAGRFEARFWTLCADPERLAEVLDNQLNWNQRFEYLPASGRVILFRQAAANQRGERCGLMLIAERRRRDTGKTRQVAYVPYLWCTDSLQMLSDSELGHPASIGWLEGTPDATGWTLSTDVTYMRNTPVQRLPLLSLAEDIEGDPDIRPTDSEGFDALAALKSVRLVLLRQFPSGIDQELTSYQALVEQRQRFSDVDISITPSRRRLHLTHCISHEIVQTLGLAYTGYTEHDGYQRFQLFTEHEGSLKARHAAKQPSLRERRA